MTETPTMSLSVDVAHQRADRLESKIDLLGDVLVDLRVQGQQRKDKLEAIEHALNDHIAEERERLNRLETRVSILEQARQQAAGARNFVEWAVRYGWAVIGALAAAIWYAEKGSQ